MRTMISAALLAAIAAGCLGAAHAQVPASAIRAAYMVEPFAPASTITIQGTGVRLRSEPFTQGTVILSHGSTGLPLTVIGIARLPDWNWYQVILKSGQKAFIRSDYTSAPSRGGGAVAPPTQLAAPLPPPSRIDYGTPSTVVSSAPASAPVPLTPPQASSAYPPSPSYVPPAPAYVPPTQVYTPQPAPVQASPQPSTGSAISLVPRSPMPSAPSDNSSGLTSVDPNVYPR